MDKRTIRAKLEMDQRWLERGVLAIDARQTPDEQVARQTRYDNDRGWNATDARKGGYLAAYIRGSRRPEGQRLTGPWVQVARFIMRKYAGQLARIAAANKAAAA